MELPIPSIVQITCILKLWKRCCPWIIQHVLTFLQVHLHVWWNVGIFHMQLNMRVTSLKNWHIFRQYQWFSGYRCTVFTLDVSVAYTSYTSCVASPSCSGSPRIGLLFHSVSFIFSLSSTCQCWLFTDKCGTYFVHGLVVRNLQVLSYNTQSSFSGI